MVKKYWKIVVLRIEKITGGVSDGGNDAEVRVQRRVWIY